MASTDGQVKVVIITRYLPPRRDAVGEHVCHLAYALAEAGLRVELVTSYGQVVLPDHPRVSVRPVVRSWRWWGLPRLLVEVREIEADLVNLHYVPQMYGRYGFNLGAAALPLLLRTVAKKPVVTTCHEIFGHRPEGLKAWLLQAIYSVQAWLILFGSSRVVVPVEWQERQLHRYFPHLATKVCRIPVGANIPVVAPEKPLEVTPPHVLTLGTFGVGHPWWQYEMAMEILKGLLTRGLRARLLCIGDIEGSNPKYYRQLRQLETQLGLEGLVEWTGYCSAEKVSCFLRSVDVFLALQQSGVTARSTALVAALAHGLPIVATRGPDADDWLLQSGAMLILDPLDAESAIRVVADLAADPQKRIDLGRHAGEFYQKHLSWETIRAKFLDVIGPIHRSSTDSDRTL